MTAVALALAAAVALGASDFLGGLLSRDRSPWAVGATAHAIACGVTLAVALAVAGTPSGSDFLWGAAAGVGEGVGIAMLFRGLSRGHMGVVAPVSGIGATLVPVLVGVTGGDQPSALAWFGIALALPAVWLIPRGDQPSVAPADRRTAFRDGVVAGLGFGAQLAFVGQIDEQAGLGPLAVLWLVSALTIVGLATLMGQRWRPGGRQLGAIAAVGVLSAGSLIAFLLATHSGLLSVVAVIAALYPAVTVLLAVAILRERVRRVQAVGLALTVATVVLVSGG